MNGSVPRARRASPPAALPPPRRRRPRPPGRLATKMRSIGFCRWIGQSGMPTVMATQLGLAMMPVMPGERRGIDLRHHQRHVPRPCGRPRNYRSPPRPPPPRAVQTAERRRCRPRTARGRCRRSCPRSAPRWPGWRRRSATPCRPSAARRRGAGPRAESVAAPGSPAARRRRRPRRRQWRRPAGGERWDFMLDLLSWPETSARNAKAPSGSGGALGSAGANALAHAESLGSRGGSFGGRLAFGDRAKHGARN